MRLSLRRPCAISMYKGLIVDLRLVTTEGFRNVPKLYGEEVKNHGEVTGVVSGFQVAGKNFAQHPRR